MSQKETWPLCFSPDTVSHLRSFSINQRTRRVLHGLSASKSRGIV